LTSSSSSREVHARVSSSSSCPPTQHEFNIFETFDAAPRCYSHSPPVSAHVTSTSSEPGSSSHLLLQLDPRLLA
jgi:hypothetical protein